ncbi:MAG TPA: hypothetical protein VND92_08795 [Vicinamibacterales bacterium]|nr:hypothetical protein [Vicinamibacterales bacterium]
MRLFAKGDRVTQPQYGAGTVTDVNEHHTVIDFDEHGTRTFVTSMVTLEASQTPAPARGKGGSRAKSAKKAPRKRVAAAEASASDSSD